MGGWFSNLGEDKYIGVKFKNEAEDCYYYGWISCVISASLEKITIKDYAYNSNCGEGLLAGMLISSISEATAKEPIIHIQNEMINIAVEAGHIGAAVFVSNAVGQVVSTTTITSTATEINTNQLSAGIYIVSIKHDGQTFTEKVIVQ